MREVNDFLKTKGGINQKIHFASAKNFDLFICAFDGEVIFRYGVYSVIQHDQHPFMVIQINEAYFMQKEFMFQHCYNELEGKEDVKKIVYHPF
ncbi:MAG: hypothetical protein JNL36_07730 [Candidatus Kapabacteria bacterium]|nr:hypothetical protein [Candidatus Kapabacteria bacterium]